MGKSLWKNALDRLIEQAYTYSVSKEQGHAHNQTFTRPEPSWKQFHLDGKKSGETITVNHFVYGQLKQRGVKFEVA